MIEFTAQADWALYGIDKPSIDWTKSSEARAVSLAINSLRPRRGNLQSFRSSVPRGIDVATEHDCDEYGQRDCNRHSPCRVVD